MVGKSVCFRSVVPVGHQAPADDPTSWSIWTAHIGFNGLFIFFFLRHEVGRRVGVDLGGGGGGDVNMIKFIENF